MRTLYPITADVKKMQAQQEEVVVQCFLAGLESQYEIARTQLLTDSELPSLAEAFSRLRKVCKDSDKDTSGVSTVSGGTSALLGWTPPIGGNRGGRSGGRGVRGGGHDNGGRGGPRICYHCGEQGHLKNNRWKLNGKPSASPRFANAATQEGLLPTPTGTVSPSLVSKPDGHILISADEYAQFTQFQATPSAATLVQSGNPTACLPSSFGDWVIDSGATNHMTSNTGSGDEEGYW
ncbi:uncharacterized protein LOC120000076 [Tripterygium wilfordii]|uniref:uncharacterized protein LOC120000076 n=1 Tax=Tripterygium wilfordii TaxID=458696 RepID=UPI0018F823FA|nr:uncharacterized protein LOC120000076 [Tripterygium wilfordii]